GGGAAEGPMPARRVLVALSLGLALPLLTADPAAAHTVTGVQPTNFRSEIISVEPPTPGVAIHLLDLGRRVEVVDDGPGEVVLLGYQGEPYLRVGPAGVFENRRSPAVYLNRPTSSGATPATPPAGVDAAAPPSWHRRSGG